jgi:UDP-N-acetylmuramyl pentapeptide phosphotransferase/UDP-N-acetylglucosamine-1-phosphate transferase
MSFWLIVAVAIIYFGIALDNLRQEDYPHALIWAAYAVANIGFVWYELTKGK